MNIKIVTINIELLNQQRDSLDEKLKNLERIAERYGEGALLVITIKKITSNQETGKIFTAEANFSIPGKDIVCKAEGNDFETTTDKLKDKLKNLMIKKKELRNGRFRRLARSLKNKLRR
jgi:ribosomal subunit interface protein